MEGAKRSRLAESRDRDGRGAWATARDGPWHNTCLRSICGPIRGQLRSLCGPESHEQPRDAANTAALLSAFSRLFARIRGYSRFCMESGRTVQIGLGMRFLGRLQRICNGHTGLMPDFGPGSDRMYAMSNTCTLKQVIRREALREHTERRSIRAHPVHCEPALREHRPRPQGWRESIF